MAAGSLETIKEFLGRKRWAIVGVSRRRLDFSRWLLQQFLNRGYEAIPVNPQAVEFDGRRCYGKLSDIQPPPAVALLMTPQRLALTLARECHEAGVRRVWFYAAAGRGAASPEAIQFGRSHGMQVVAGFCPVMFFDDAGWLHRIHAHGLKLLGCYPPQTEAPEGSGLKPGPGNGR